MEVDASPRQDLKLGHFLRLTAALQQAPAWKESSRSWKAMPEPSAS